jgi:hypothetical protein
MPTQITVYLVPLKAGSLQLPGVMVRALPSGAGPHALPYLPSCELQYVNAAQRIEVTPAGPASASFWVPE